MKNANTYLLFFYRNGNRVYTYVDGNTIDEAWKTACSRYGEENLEMLS